MAYTTIDDPSVYFQTALYTGDASTQDVTNSGNSDLQPDWIWIKNRDAESNHIAQDTSRGINVCFFPDDPAVEQTNSNFGHVNSVASDGFQVDEGNSGEANANKNTEKYVAWQWKANGGSTTSFSASSAQLAGTRQSNTTAGFSIITYTGDGNNNATIPHGLNSAPKFVIIKERGNATNWYVGHDGTFTTGEIFLNNTNALAAAFGPFNKTAPTASNIVLGTDGSVNGSSDTYVCYAFAEIQGYSKFGSYTGNGSSSEGPFVYLGFKPAWLLYRNVDRTENWIIVDNKRNPINRVAGANLQANENAAEANETRWGFDFLSNGFKVRQTQAQNANNGNGEKIIYMAFAEHPFVSSEGVPTTAR